MCGGEGGHRTAQIASLGAVLVPGCDLLNHDVARTCTALRWVAPTEDDGGGGGGGGDTRAATSPRVCAAPHGLPVTGGGAFVGFELYAERAVGAGEELFMS